APGPAGAATIKPETPPTCASVFQLRALAERAKPERMPCWSGRPPRSWAGPFRARTPAASENQMSDMNPVLRWFHQLGSPPYFDRFAARWATWGHVLGALVMAWGVYGALFQVPADYQQ